MVGLTQIDSLRASRTSLSQPQKRLMQNILGFAIFGERVALLWAEGKRDAAISARTTRANDLARTRKVDILCAYPSKLRIQEDKTFIRGSFVENTQVFAPGKKALTRVIGNCEIVQECPFSAVLF